MRGEEPDPQFSRDVLPLFQKRCGSCHGKKRRKGRLDLSTPESIARGGKKGPAVVPGKPEESRLWRRVFEEEMPPDDPIPAAEVEILRAWIAAGAPGLPRIAGPTGAALDSREGHRAFGKIGRPGIPRVESASSVRMPVDRFILARLEEKGLTFSEEANRATLFRRLAFDLTGLPPSIERLEAFLADASPDGYERVVDEYLSSPAYGERWGKYWLEAAGYADSNGYFHADTERPLAYRYRDYVIRSFNDDKPFARFLLEQIAGDELVGYRPGGDVLPDMVEALVATHFLRNGQDGTGESDGNPLERRIDKLKVLESTVEILGSCLLGLTVRCARCHDHKFEPVTQKEYYQLQAVLTSAFDPERWLKPNERLVTIGTRAEREAHALKVKAIEAKIEALEKGLQEFAGGLRKQIIEERLQDLAEGERASVRLALQTAEKKRSDEQKALLEKHRGRVQVSDEDLAGRFPEYGPRKNSVSEAIRIHKKERPAPLEKIACVHDIGEETPAHRLLTNGDYRTPGEDVQPGVPAVLSSGTNRYRVEDAREGRVSSGRRTALARWLTSTENPLVERVFVNRVWQRLFGTGLVKTANNLGRSGEPPSHPELLDHLAMEFRRSGGSVKALVRRIVCSAAYRQTSALRRDADVVDPGGRLFWRYPLRRLDAECVRDAMLQISGQLDRRLFGPFVPTKRTGDGRVVVELGHRDARRRSVYVQQRRTQILTMLELFDAPVITTSCTGRDSTTVPLQSLSLLNGGFVLARARDFAGRLHRETSGEPGESIRRAFLLTMGRGPDEVERRAAESFLASQSKVYTDREDGRRMAWIDFCQMLLASNGFLYVE